jgi:hypothetical protein
VAVSIDPSQVAVSNFQGFGAQWDCYRNSADNTVPQLVRDRIAYMRLPWARTRIDLSWYSDANNNYDWTGPSAVAILNLLAAAKANGTKVHLTEWYISTAQALGWVSDPTTVNPKYPKAICDGLDYLINARGFTNIERYILINEPSGSIPVTMGWTDEQAYSYWKYLVQTVNSQIVSRGIPVKIAAPDSVETTAGNTWFTRATTDINSIVADWDRHLYPSYGSIEAGSAEGYARTQWGTVKANDRNWRTKGFVIAEAGLKPTSSGGYDLSSVDYGTHMADYGIQLARGGITVVSAWMLDDESYPQGLDSPDQFWGMWSTRATASTLKPWFWSWSLLSRHARPGSVAYKPSSSASTIHPGAFRNPATGTWVFTFVNWSSTDQSVVLTVPGQGNVTYDRYIYSTVGRAMDTNGFPVPAASALSGSLTTGISEMVPTKGALYLVATAVAAGAPP